MDQTVAIRKCDIEVELSTNKIYTGRSQCDENYIGDLGKENFRGTKNSRGKIFRSGYRGNFRNDKFGRGRSRYTERQYSDNFRRNKRSSRSRSGSREREPIEIELDAIRCREYYHFAKDCPNISETEREQSEQI